MGGISIWQIILILLVVLVLFGMGKLPKIAGELGKALKMFRSSVGETEAEPKNQKAKQKPKKGILTTKTNRSAKSTKTSQTSNTSRTRPKTPNKKAPVKSKKK